MAFVEQTAERHSFGPYFEGMNNPFEHYDSEENRKVYELSQQQRAMERRIRKTKREVMGLKTAADSAGDQGLKAQLSLDYQSKAALLQRQNQAYKAFCAENRLRPLQDRLTVAKWDRKQAAMATGAAKRYESTGVKNAAGERISIVKQTKITAQPNTITQRVNAKGGIDRNFYGDNGRQTLQISNNGHGHKKEEALGVHGEHAHDYIWDKDGNMTRSEARELTEQERRNNHDFLR